jgi:hypothetical protein
MWLPVGEPDNLLGDEDIWREETRSCNASIYWLLAELSKTDCDCATDDANESCFRGDGEATEEGVVVE